MASRLDKNTLIIVGAVLGLEIVACGGTMMSIHKKKTALEQTLAGKETALADVRTVSASLPAMQDQYTKMQSQVKFLEQALPPAAYIPTLLGQVEETARASGVTIQSFRPVAAAPAAPAEGEDKAADAAAKRQFDMTISGDYANVQKFLQSLTKFRKILALESIQLQPAAADRAGGSPSLTGTLSFTAYILAPGPADNPPAGATPDSGKAVASSQSATAPRG
jgi:Tfp pilus assembly protein PilO